MVDVRLKPRTRNQYRIGEYPYNLLSTIVNESVWETNLPNEFTDDHLDGLEYAITQLDIRERAIIKQRYMEKKTFSQIALLFNITGNRVSQIERNALRKLYSPKLLKYYKYGLIGYKQKLIEFDKAENNRSNEEKIMNKSIQDIDFSIRTLNNLIRANYETIGDLAALTEYEILKIKNMGKKQLAEVAKRLNDIGVMYTSWNKFLP